MQDPTQTSLTDDELRNFAADPRLTPADIARLNPDEKTRFAALKKTPPPSGSTRPGSLFNEKAADVGIGAAKGAGTTATSLGSLVSNPVTTALGNYLGGEYAKARYGPESVTPPVESKQAFDVTQKDLEAQGPYQKVGKAVEQVGEYLIPGGATRQAVSRGAIAAAPTARLVLGQSGRVGNALVNLLERGAADAASTGAVAALHGDEHPGREALAGATIPGAVGALTKVAGPLIEATPYAAGGAAATALHHVGHDFAGLAGGLGLMQYVRGLMHGQITPGRIAAARALIQRYGPQAFRAMIGTAGQMDNPNQ